jgi:hypothetical protein
MWIKFLRWLLFGVCVALMPLGWNALRTVIRGGIPTLQELCSHGELFLIAGAIAARALGEIVASGRDLGIYKLLSGVGCVGVLMVSSVLFADVSGYLSMGQSYDKASTAWISIYIYLFNLFASGSCVILSTLSEIKP